uniref:Variant surface glycoprotein 1524 n=1 Tax=Trypanosoma brucei TaxID=5691 RepID=M4TBU1_9TRYP|nr:variant surface glycoprotein 1524 [Trypanosoma brucei]
MNPAAHFTALLIIVSAAEIVAPTPHLHDTTKQLNDACNVSDHLRQLDQAIRSRVVSQTTEIEKATQTAARLRAAIAAGDNQQRRLLGPVLIHVVKQIDEATALLTANIASAIEGAAAASELAGVLSVVREVAELKIEDVTYALAGTFLSASGKQLIAEVPTATDATCDKTTFDGRTAEDRTAAFSQTITLDLYQLTDTAASGTSTVGPRICGDNDGADPLCSNSAALNTGTQLGIKGGKLPTLCKAAYTRPTSSPNTDYASTTAKTTGAIPTKNYYDSVLKKLKTGEEAARKLSFKAPTITDDTATATDDFQAAIMQLQLNIADQQQKSKHQDNIDKIIQKDYGKADGKYQAKVWETVQNKANNKVYQATKLQRS